MSNEALSRLRTRVRRTSVLSAKISAAATGVHREGRAFIVVANGRAHGGNFVRAHAQLIQNTKGHHRAALRVVNPIDDVADIVKISRDPGQLSLSAP